MPFTYPVLINPAGSNYSASSPDVDGCVAVGATEEETLENFREALEFHLDGLREDGLSIPLPASRAASVTVEVEVPD